MICNNCGTENTDGSQSCSNCSRNLKVQRMPNKYAPKHHNLLKELAIILGLILGGIFCFVSLPWVLIGFGVILSPNPPIPIIKHGEFPFHLVYKVDGNQYTIDDTIICDYAGIGMDEGNGKYIKWEERLVNGNQITRFFFRGEYQYGIKLLDGVIPGQGSTMIICDIGTPQYYLGYKKYKDYSPGRVSIFSSLTTGVMDEDELWNKYKIKLIEKKFSQPIVGNGISESSPYRDVARMAAKGVTATPQESSYPPGTKQILFTWKNDTDKRLTCEEPFYIQKKVDGKWEDVYREKAVGFSREKISLEPHTQITHTYDISKYTKNISTGSYRVVSPVIVPLKRNTYEARVLCGEFTIN
jgi:hypothetical protein